MPTWYPDEAAPYIGKGFIGGRVSLDGHGADGGRVAALAAYYVGPEEQMAPVPHWLNVPLKVNGQTVRPIFVDYHQTLDIARGTLATSYQDAEGRLRVETETFCHRGRREITPYRMTVRALQDAQVELEPRLDHAPGWCRPASARPEAAEPGVSGWVLDFGDPAALLAQLLAVECSVGTPQRVVGESTVGQRFTVTLKAGQTCALTGIVASCRGASPLQEARRILADARRTGYAGLRAGHVKEMKTLWEGFQVEADDPYLERKMRSAMFYLLCGYRHDVILGGSLTGLTGSSGWGGCVFWDSDFYMFPALLPFYPELAANIVRYRHQTLDGARRNAREHGEQGARFPWQSHRTGRSLYQGGFEEERHISSDVAYSAWWYAWSAADKDFMRREARELIVEVARNWASRAVLNRRRKRYELHGVIPPDEHVWDHYVGKPIDNSVMTNAYARWVLQTAVDLFPDSLTEKERAEWKRIADRMCLPRNAKLKIYREYDGYNGHPIKQADAGHLFFPLCVDGNPAEIKRNIYYYAERDRATQLYLAHSPVVYACALSRAGDVKGVTHFFRLSDRNTVGPFELPRESNYGGGIYVMTAGGFLDIVLYGLLGIENLSEKLTAHSCLSDEVGRIRISGFHFRGKRYAVEASPGKKAKIAAVG